MSQEFLEFKTEILHCDEGKSVQAILQSRFKLSGARLRKLRRRGAVYKNGIFTPMIAKVQAKDHLRAVLPELTEPELDLKSLSKYGAEVIYQDRHILVIRKPAGLLVHPSFQESLALTTILSSKPLHPVRRLDLDSSGLVIIGKNPYAHERLSNRPLHKQYRILVHGRLPFKELKLAVPIARNQNFTMQRIVQDKGALSVSIFREWQYFPDARISLLSVECETGKTHQIRSHALYLGLPLLGDWLYGLDQLPKYLSTNPLLYSQEAKIRLENLIKAHAAGEVDEVGFKRHALDADLLEFTAIDTELPLHLNSPWPQDFLDFFRKKGEVNRPRPQ